MSGVRGRGRVGAPFTYQTLAALDAVEAGFAGRQLATALAIYVALTRIANDEGSMRFSAERREVAARSGTSVRTVGEYAPKLEAAGVLVVHRQDGEASGWELVEPTPAAAAGGAAAPAGGVGSSRRGLDTLIEEQQPSSSGARTPEAEAAEMHGLVQSPELIRDAEELLLAKRKVDGRLVKAGEMVKAAVALDEFNRQLGRDFGLGAHLTPLVMRIRDRPSWDAAKFQRLVRSACRVRWWEANGRSGRAPTPAVIFGNERVFEAVVQDAAAEAAGESTEQVKRRRFVKQSPVEQQGE